MRKTTYQLPEGVIQSGEQVPKFTDRVDEHIAQDERQGGNSNRRKDKLEQVVQNMFEQ